MQLSHVVVAWNSGKKLSRFCLSNIVCCRLEVTKMVASTTGPTGNYLQRSVQSGSVGSHCLSA